MRHKKFKNYRARCALGRSTRFKGFMSMTKASALKLLVVVFILICPALFWFLFKPIRLLAPELNGLFCQKEYLCIDNLDSLDSAMSLYDSSLLFVENNVGKINEKPLIIFCSTDVCSRSFGMGRRSAMQLPIGIVISPRAWEKHYISHELIHQLQQQEFGALYSYKKPKWYLEGMAYFLSNDPRNDLGHPLQDYRTEFQVWYKDVGKDNLWSAGKSL